MTTMASRGPTDREAAYLSALSTALTAPVANSVAILNELQDMLRVCRLPWVADFMFNTEMTSLSAFTAPLNMRNAITSTVQMTHVQCDSNTKFPFFGINFRPFDISINGSFVFVPSFSVGSISVGFGVQQCWADSYMDWNSSSPRGEKNKWKNSHFRFARDDENGVFVMVRKDNCGDQECIKLEAMSNITATTRKRVYTMFDFVGLQNAVHTDQGILPTEKVLSALRVINYSTESRDCPYCGSKSSIPCKCKFNLAKPAHPLDFSSLKKNLSLYLGVYEGTAQGHILNQGTGVSGANVGTRTHITPDMDDELLKRLSNWVISDQLSGKKENPLALIMPHEDVVPESQVCGAGILDVSLSAEGLIGDNRDNPLDIVMDANDIDLNASSCSPGSGADIARVGTGNIVVDTLDEAQSMRGASGSADTFEKRAVGEVEEAPEKSTWTGISDDAMDLVDTIAALQNVDGMWDSGLMEGGSPGSLSIARTEDSYAVQSTSSGHGLSQTPRTLSIAPAVVIETMGKEKQDEKALRAEKRKQRNREAAQRSNARRKLKNDALNQALNESHDKAAQLRARELSLREENLELRRLTSS